MSPILTEGSLDFISHSEAQTQRLGLRLAQFLEPGDVIALIGDLGSGKTRWVQGVCRGLGVDDSVPVISPTFTLINEYEGQLPIYHIDLYRLTDTNEMLNLGLEDYLFGAGVTLIEWADRAETLLPDNHLTVELYHLEPTKRRIVMQANGGRGTTLLHQFKHSAFAHPHTSQ
ncbi:MAG: tRNA (adenosine(37)-N6)-threonylcarbamoyltransferase complex ATPase subunit type 1 TsaE [Anaerolineae bacterium]|nr:tRNA (adenosine(37)-N6)-threonylcarbamoyltransferase complex ATPase subunit type 1 TsaE [Anaerolineae bacterium]